MLLRRRDAHNKGPHSAGDQRGDADPTEGESGKMLLNPLAKRCGVVDVWKWLVFRNRHAEERAERFPALLDFEDERPLRWNR